MSPRGVGPDAPEVEVFSRSGSLPYSARVAHPGGGVSPRGLLVCVHGGGMTSGYFDSPADHALSVLRQFARGGFVAFAPDRPGYGATPAREFRTFEDHASWLATCVDDYRTASSVDLPMAVIGHSMGSMVSTAYAALAPRNLVALSTSGISSEYRPERLTSVDPASAETPSSDLWWGDRTLYPTGALSSRTRPTAPVSDADRSVALTWPGAAALIASSCRVPVQVILGSADMWWVGGEPGLSAFARLFTGAPWLDVHELRNAAHNFALGWAARPYAYRVLSFVEDVIAGLAREPPRESSG